jgi:hypothetical protein
MQNAALSEKKILSVILRFVNKNRMAIDLQRVGLRDLHNEKPVFVAVQAGGDGLKYDQKMWKTFTSSGTLPLSLI